MNLCVKKNVSKLVSKCQFYVILDWFIKLLCGHRMRMRGGHALGHAHTRGLTVISTIQGKDSFITIFQNLQQTIPNLKIKTQTWTFTSLSEVWRHTYNSSDS